MFYGDILHQTVNVTINMSPTTRVLRSARSYATVSPPRSRCRPLNRGRAPTISRSGPSGRGRSRSASSRGRGRGRSAPPSSACKANSSRSVARANNKRTTVAPSAPIVQPTPPMSNEAIRKAMASSMGPFDSDSEDDSLVDLAGAGDDGRGDGRDGLVFTPPPLLSANSLICFRGFANAPSKSQSYLFDKMTRSEKKNDPSFELIAMIITLTPTGYSIWPTAGVLSLGMPSPGPLSSQVVAQVASYISHPLSSH
eukprot:scaffold44563_cov23-Cyclotella_meneghiniana.AAC.1